MAEELFGGSWVLTTSPNSGSGSNVLSDVSCPAVGACTAVGYFDNGTVDRALAESLSASVWAVTPVQDQGTGLNELNGISCPATGSCVSVGTYRTAAGVNQDLIETLAAGTWSVHHPSPDANGANNELTAVSCTALTSCMAVGHYNSKGVAQSLAIELAHGTWTVVQSPDKGTSTNQLVGVSCPAGAALECEGVGYYNDLISGFADVAAQALAQTWSGGSWSLVPAADAMVSDVSANGVSCSAAGSCVAVGSYVNASGIREVFIEDLANGTWSMVPGPVPSPTTNSLGGVSCPSATSCVAVGSYATAKTGQALIEKLSGGTWAVTPSPDQGTGYNQLNGVSCAAVVSCVAVGYYSAGAAPRVLIETLANGSWTLTPSPALTASASYLESVSCSSPTTCVAVGYDYNGTGRRTLIETLANGAWTVASSPNAGPGDNLLDAVSCWSPANCVAVGYYASGKAHLGLVEALGAGGWAVSQIPQPSVTGDYPSGVSCTASGACALVGNYLSGAGGTVDQTLVETAGIGGWAVVPTPSPDTGGDSLGAVSCVALANCVAVGHFVAGASQGSLAESAPPRLGWRRRQPGSRRRRTRRKWASA